MSSKVREIITNRLIKKLEEGIVPWRMTWNPQMPMNYVSRKRYNGINVLLLQSTDFSCPYWATWNQIKRAGGTVNKGASSEMVVYYKTKKIAVEEKVEDEGEVVKDNNGDPLTETVKKTIPLTRYYRVFNIEQTSLTIPNQEKNKQEVNRDARDVWESWQDRPALKGHPSRCFYDPLKDDIALPPVWRFESADHHSATWFHEMVHSTGHKSRLDRFDNGSGYVRDGHDYSKEELIAEIGSAILLSRSGIQVDWDNKAAYIGGWLKKLGDDNNLIFRASSKADKAANYILGGEDE